MALCRCCFISAIPALISHTERPVALCVDCVAHYGDSAKTEAAHERMMETYRTSNATMLERLDERREALTVELAASQEAVRILTATIVSDYFERPIGDVQSVVEKAIVEQATLRAGAAERARDRVMCAVFRIDELHHEAGDNCSCGKRITQCSEFSALDFIRTPYYAWEKPANRAIQERQTTRPAIGPSAGPAISGQSLGVERPTLDPRTRLRPALAYVLGFRDVAS